MFKALSYFMKTVKLSGRNPSLADSSKGIVNDWLFFGFTVIFDVMIS